MSTKLRQSIHPTYDHRKTGDRYRVTTKLNGRPIDFERPITDPFIHTRVTIGFWDALKSLLRFGEVEVRVSVTGDPAIMEDVLELNSDYLGHNNTRRNNFNADIEKALGEMP